MQYAVAEWLHARIMTDHDDGNAFVVRQRVQGSGHALTGLAVWRGKNPRNLGRPDGLNAGK